MGTTAAIALADLLLSAGINYILKAQEANAKIAAARAEGRDVTPEELAEIKAARDILFNETMAALSAD